MRKEQGARGLETQVPASLLPPTCPWHRLARAGTRVREVGQPRCEMLAGLGSLSSGLGLSVPFLYRHQGQPRVMSPNFHGLQQGLPELAVTQRSGGLGK